MRDGGGSGPAQLHLHEVSLDLNISFWMSSIAKPRQKLSRLAAKESRGRRRQKNIGKVSGGAEFQNVPTKLISLPLLRETSPKQ